MNYCTLLNKAESYQSSLVCVSGNLCLSPSNPISCFSRSNRSCVWYCLWDGRFLNWSNGRNDGLLLLCRYGFQEICTGKTVARNPKVQEYDGFLNRNSFVAILTCRLIPIIPAPVVNIICGLSHVSLADFLYRINNRKTTKYTSFVISGASFSNNKLFSFGLYGLYLLIIFLINLGIVYRRSATKSA